VVPFAIPGVAGVTAMDTSVAGVIVSVVDPETLPDVAVIVVEPAAAEAASPELLIVDTPVLDELQVTVVVRFWVELSENVPVAVSC
jgi:fructose-1-phosphate kinase PfkB-like protein